MFILFSLLILTGCSDKEEKNTIFVYVGANLKEPISELANAYEQETGIEVELTFNNSGTLLNQIAMMKKGDIFIPGGYPFIELADEKGLIDEIKGPIAYHVPVIITPKDNPMEIHSIEDLSKDGVELLIPEPDATAIGKLAYKVFDKTSVSTEIKDNISATLETPIKVLNLIKMGQGNAGIVEYSNTYKEKDYIEVIEIDTNINEIENIMITSLIYTKDNELTNDFLTYIEDNGAEVFLKYGFKTQR